MCESRNSTKTFVSLDDSKEEEKIVKVDRCMSKIIRALKSSDQISRTLACCCGHGRYPMTIIVSWNGYIYELLSGEPIPRKKRFYKKDSQGFYYVPEIMGCY